MITWSDISTKAKGVLLMVMGGLLLLHSLGILARGINMLIIIAAITMIALGFIMCDGPTLIAKFFKKRSPH